MIEVVYPSGFLGTPTCRCGHHSQATIHVNSFTVPSGNFKAVLRKIQGRPNSTPTPSPTLPQPPVPRGSSSPPPATTQHPGVSFHPPTPTPGAPVPLPKRRAFSPGSAGRGTHAARRAGSAASRTHRCRRLLTTAPGSPAWQGGERVPSGGGAGAWGRLQAAAGARAGQEEAEPPPRAPAPAVCAARSRRVASPPAIYTSAPLPVPPAALRAVLSLPRWSAPRLSGPLPSPPLPRSPASRGAAWVLRVLPRSSVQHCSVTRGHQQTAPLKPAAPVKSDHQV